MRTETIGDATLYLADCRELLQAIEADCVVTDPPYGVTSLEWDTAVEGWAELVRARQMWCFGSMRFFLGQTLKGNSVTTLNTAKFYQRMWALIGPDGERWGFDVYFTRAEARRVKGAGEKIVPVVVYSRGKK